MNFNINFRGAMLLLFALCAIADILTGNILFSAGITTANLLAGAVPQAPTSEKTKESMVKALTEALASANHTLAAQLTREMAELGFISAGGGSDWANWNQLNPTLTTVSCTLVPKEISIEKSKNTNPDGTPKPDYMRVKVKTVGAASTTGGQIEGFVYVPAAASEAILAKLFAGQPIEYTIQENSLGKGLSMPRM